MSETNNGAVASESIESQENSQTESSGSESSAAEQVADLQAQAKDPNLSKEEKKEIQKQLKKIKYKADGQEFEEELDLSNEQELAKKLSLAKAAQKRMQESTALKKDVETFIQLLKTNPKKVLADPNIGVDLREFANSILQEQLEEEKKTPEQKRIEELERKLQEELEAKEKEKQDREADEYARMQAEAERKYEEGFTKALEMSGLEKSPYTVTKMVDIMKNALELGYDPSPEQIAQILRARVEADVKSLFSSSNEDILDALLGDDAFSKIQKRRLAKSRAAAKVQTAVPKVASEETSKKEEKKISAKEFFGF
jgi:hypothetical protein